jgi:hypothetical protein
MRSVPLYSHSPLLLDADVTVINWDALRHRPLPPWSAAMYMWRYPGSFRCVAISLRRSTFLSSQLVLSVHWLVGLVSVGLGFGTTFQLEALFQESSIVGSQGCDS